METWLETWWTNVKDRGKVQWCKQDHTFSSTRSLSVLVEKGTLSKGADSFIL